MTTKASRELLKSLKFCVIDLETTGGNHESDQIIEIGLVQIRGLEITSSKNYLVNPQKQIPEFIQKLTSIKQEDVENCTTIDLIIDEVIEYIGDDIIVAHNTSFDVPFLNSVMRRLNKPELKNRVICTNVMTKHMIPEIMTSNLNYMSQLFGIDHANAHRAKDDAVATAKLLLKFLEIFESKGIKKVNQLYYPRNKFELDRLHINSKTPIKKILEIIKSQKDNPMALSFKGPRGLILAVLPIENPAEEIEFIEKVMNELDWDILTIKLICPLLDGFFQFNNHLQKYKEENRVLILDYLANRYKKNEVAKFRLHDYDILIGHHLVRNQITVFNFLNLNTNTKHLFKIPAQKKKMLNFIQSQVNRFNNQKKQKRSILHEELFKIVESYLSDQIERGEFLHIPAKSLKNNETQILKQIEGFTLTKPKGIHFPQNHL